MDVEECGPDYVHQADLHQEGPDRPLCPAKVDQYCSLWGALRMRIKESRPRTKGLERTRAVNEKTAKPIDDRLLAIPLNYADLVEYQEGAVVSRTIINKAVGTVTVFAFDKGERLSTHSAPFDALLQVVDGTGVVTIEGTEHEVTAPQFIIMPADKPHAVDARERFKMVLVMIRAK